MNMPIIIILAAKKAVGAITYQLVKLFAPTTSMIHMITISPAF